MTRLNADQYREAEAMAAQISLIWRSNCPERSFIEHPTVSQFSTYFNPRDPNAPIKGKGGTSWINLFFPIPCCYELNEATAITVGLLLHEWLHVIQQVGSPEEVQDAKKRQDQLESEFQNIGEIPPERLWQDYYSDPLEIQAHAVQ